MYWSILAIRKRIRRDHEEITYELTQVGMEDIVNLVMTIHHASQDALIWLRMWSMLYFLVQGLLRIEKDWRLSQKEAAYLKIFLGSCWNQRKFGTKSESCFELFMNNLGRKNVEEDNKRRKPQRDAIKN